MLLGAWGRYAATAHALSSRGAYALIMVGQVNAIHHHEERCTYPISKDLWWHRAASLPDPWTKILRELVQP